MIHYMDNGAAICGSELAEPSDFHIVNCDKCLHIRLQEAKLSGERVNANGFAK